MILICIFSHIIINTKFVKLAVTCNNRLEPALNPSECDPEIVSSLLLPLTLVLTGFSVIKDFPAASVKEKNNLLFLKYLPFASLSAFLSPGKKREWEGDFGEKNIIVISQCVTLCKSNPYLKFLLK